MGTKYCNECVCLCVSLSVSLGECVRNHVSKLHQIFYAMLYVVMLVLLWKLSNMLCTYGFADNVMCSYYGPSSCLSLLVTIILNIL